MEQSSRRDTGKQERSNDAVFKWIAMVALAGLAIWAASSSAIRWWESGAEERERQDRIAQLKSEIQSSQQQAFMSCRKAILAAAAYGKPSGPGRIEPSGTSASWVFSWPHGSFYFQNGFGAEVPQSARCEVHVDSGQILSLVISNREIIQR